MSLKNLVIGSTILLSLFSNVLIASHYYEESTNERRREDPQQSEKNDLREALILQESRLREKGGIILFHRLGSTDGTDVVLRDSKLDKVKPAEKIALLRDYSEAAQVYLDVYGEELKGNTDSAWRLKQKIDLVRWEMKKIDPALSQALDDATDALREETGGGFWNSIGGSKKVSLTGGKKDVSSARRVVLLQKYVEAAEKYLKLYGEDSGNAANGWQLKQKIVLAKAKLRELTD